MFFSKIKTIVMMLAKSRSPKILSKFLIFHKGIPIYLYSLDCHYFIFTNGVTCPLFLKNKKLITNPLGRQRKNSNRLLEKQRKVPLVVGDL